MGLVLVIHAAFDQLRGENFGGIVCTELTVWSLADEAVGGEATEDTSYAVSVRIML